MFSGHVFEFVEEIGRKRRSEIFNGFFSRDDVYISQFFAADLFKAVSVVRRRKKDLPRVYRYLFIVKDVIQFSVGQKGKFPVVVMSVHRRVIESIDMVRKRYFIDKFFYSFRREIVVFKAVFHNSSIRQKDGFVNAKRLFFRDFLSKTRQMLQIVSLITNYVLK